MPYGRIDVHSHLLPALDDGCSHVEESVACARMLVAHGYTHTFCTPHIWPNLPKNNVQEIPTRVKELQQVLDDRKVRLTLLPGGELNLIERTIDTPPEQLVSYAMKRKYLLFDLWAEKLPSYFEPTVKWFQSLGMQPILAHPERMRAVQEEPELADYFAGIGLLLQGNLQCLGDPPHAHTRRVGEQYLLEGRYFMLGSDLHNVASMPVRLAGLEKAIELVGEDVVTRLTRENPAQLM